MINVEKNNTIDFEALKVEAFNAMKENNEEATKVAFNNLFDAMAEQAKQIAEDKTTELHASINDNQIMIERGARRPITSAEMKFFNEAVEKQKIDGLNELFPKTIIETIMADLTKEHPLLSAIDTKYTEAAIKYIYSDPTKAVAYWDIIPADIRQILLGAFKSLDIMVAKLSGYIALPKGYFQLGPAWLANYVTTSLREVITMELENAVVNGNGKNKPIGLLNKLSGAVDGVYPAKDKVKVTELTPLSLAGVRALFAKEKTLNGQLSIVVNPATAALKITPGRFFQDTVTGAWHENALPYNMNIVESHAMPEDVAVVGNLKNYLLAVAGDLEITKYTETLAIEDMDLYIGKMFANGLAKNPNAFVVLDLADMEGATEVTAEAAANIVAQDTISPAGKEDKTPEV
ncbi:phage major capsid protein [Globicatella sanguinis]